MSNHLPQWKCHKVVRAAKIASITPTTYDMHAVGFEGDLSPIQVTTEWIVNKRAEVGGYYVVYEDGYASYSPAKAFEEGYTRL